MGTPVHEIDITQHLRTADDTVADALDVPDPQRSGR